MARPRITHHPRHTPALKAPPPHRPPQVTGLEQEAMDPEGWAYAVDFPWLLAYPPPPGSGKTTMKSFVRRRRWVGGACLPRLP